MKGIYKFLLIVLLVTGLLQIQKIKAQNISIDLSKENQIIRGFGGIHINSWTGQELNEDICEKTFDNDPGEIGLTIFRLRISPDSTNWEAELPAAQYAANKGAIVFASPWNPPSEMRELLAETSYGTDYVLLPKYYDDYVEHLNNYIAYMNDNSVPLYAISVQNEPDWHGWTVWTSQEMLTFVKENAPNINCKVIAPESLGYIRSMINPLLNDSVANSHINILGTHLYGTDKDDYYYPLAYEKEKEIWMTEHLFGSDSQEDNTWSLAMEMAEEINTCMDANMSAYIYWYIRRFYGLINDEGNITDKGYVMSQFTKFVRPGSYRVDTEISSAENITATAYKTDTSLVVVVLNHNDEAVNLDLTVQNNIIGIDSLTKFTTSATKKIINDGNFVIEEGSFSASIDANSITTFSSVAAQGGKYGNIPPLASGGSDQEIMDTDGTGVSLTLKGSESTDSDGEIVKYSWSQDGYQISTESDPDMELEVGNYCYILTITDNDGATDVDTVNISIYTNNTTEIWLEAECTEVGDAWEIITDDNSSNNKYLTVTSGIEAKSEPSSDTNDLLLYTFHLNESGNYRLWGRVLAPSADDDSYWIKMDNDDWVMWNGIEGGSTWQWDDVHSYSDSPIVYTLDTGYHTLSVCYREDGAAIDKFYLTNTGTKPSGMGEDAENCEDIVTAIDLIDFNQTVIVFPNPVNSTLCIKSSIPFNSIIVYDISGRKIMNKNFSVARTSSEIPVNFGSGIYILKLKSVLKTMITKFLVEN